MRRRPVCCALLRLHAVRCAGCGWLRLVAAFCCLLRLGFVATCCASESLVPGPCRAMELRPKRSEAEAVQDSVAIDKSTVYCAIAPCCSSLIHTTLPATACQCRAAAQALFFCELLRCDCCTFSEILFTAGASENLKVCRIGHGHYDLCTRGVTASAPGHGPGRRNQRLFA